MNKFLFCTMIAIVLLPIRAFSYDKFTYIDTVVLSVKFCDNEERESFCVQTNKGIFVSPPQFGGVISEINYKELFFDLNFVQGEGATLVIYGKDIVGIKTPHWDFVAKILKND